MSEKVVPKSQIIVKVNKALTPSETVKIVTEISWAFIELGCEDIQITHEIIDDPVSRVKEVAAAQ